MKLSIAILLLTMSFGAHSLDREVIEASATIEARNVRCVTPVMWGEDRRFMEIPGRAVNGVWEMKLQHVAFRGSGCDMETLKELLEPSSRRFGFIFAKAEIIRDTKFSMTGIGEGRFRCQKTVTENITLDLGRDTLFKSREHEFVWVDDKECE